MKVSNTMCSVQFFIHLSNKLSYVLCAQNIFQYVDIKVLNQSSCNVGHIFLPFIQEKDEEVVQTPEITQRVHHATDEEKLASTSIMGQPTDRQEDREELKCNKMPGKKQHINDKSVVDGKFQAVSSTHFNIDQL